MGWPSVLNVGRSCADGSEDTVRVSARTQPATRGTSPAWRNKVVAAEEKQSWLQRKAAPVVGAHISGIWLLSNFTTRTR